MEQVPGSEAVIAAIERLVDAIDNAIEATNIAGASAFQSRDYGQVAEVSALAEEILSFRGRVEGIREEWRALPNRVQAARLRKPQPPTDPLTLSTDRRAASGDGRRHRSPSTFTGVATSSREFALPVLSILADFGGAARKAEVLDGIERQYLQLLTEGDWEINARGDGRWRVNAGNVRSHLIERGWLYDGADKGLWELSEQGRREVERYRSVNETMPSPTLHIDTAAQ
jgi:hypothetical protein